MTDKEIEQGIENACSCSCSNPSPGWTVNPYPIIRDYIRRLKAENAALRERLDNAVGLPFIVIDKKTGKEADEYEIALHEDWAKHLMYCDMEGFAIEQDGTLILLDERGQFAYCLSDRFEVVPEARLAELKRESGGREERAQEGLT